MNERSLTPNITVTIGHHTRIYFAFVTTAPTERDSPATVTLHAATFADVLPPFCCNFISSNVRSVVASGLAASAAAYSARAPS